MWSLGTFMFDVKAVPWRSRPSSVAEVITTGRLYVPGSWDRRQQARAVIRVVLEVAHRLTGGNDLGAESEWMLRFLEENYGLRVLDPASSVDRLIGRGRP